MIQEVKMFTVVCDNCGADCFDKEDISGWNDESYAEECAMNFDWLKEDDKHYCTYCFSYNDEDELIIDESRQILKSKRNENNT